MLNEYAHQLNQVQLFGKSRRSELLRNELAGAWIRPVIFYRYPILVAIKGLFSFVARGQSPCIQYHDG